MKKLALILPILLAAGCVSPTVRWLEKANNRFPAMVFTSESPIINLDHVLLAHREVGITNYFIILVTTNPPPRLRK